MKKLVCLLLALLLMLSVCACSKPTNGPTNKTNVNVFVLTGPTGIGAVNFMEKAATLNGGEVYSFSAVAEPTEIVSKISNKQADIAAVPTNLAASLYNKTGGGVKVLAVNTLGVLYVLTNKGTEVASINDLAGKKIYATGQGSNPEYIINYILDKNNINRESDLTIEYKAKGEELVAVWKNDPNAVIIAPQPVATSILMNYEGATRALSLTDEWSKIDSASALMQGCVVVRTEFLEEHPKAVENFLKEYKASIEAAQNDAESTAALCEKFGIVPKAAIAKAAMPYVGLCYIDGSEMKTKLSGFLTVMFGADPKSVGGKLPGEDFWYEK